jgi:hypothetical protein
MELFTLADEIRNNYNSETKPAAVYNHKNASALIADLYPLVKSGNTKCLEYSEQIRELLLPWYSHAETLIDEIEDFQFDNALKLLDIMQNNSRKEGVSGG